MSPPSSLEKPAEHRLAYGVHETCSLLGGISPVTLWRLQRRGLIKPIRTLRIKLFTREEIERFLESEAAS